MITLVVVLNCIAIVGSLIYLAFIIRGLPKVLRMLYWFLFQM